MSAGWVAGTVRARGLASRRLGREGARAVAASPSLPAALRTLEGSPYGHDVHAGQSLGEAQHAVAATLLWHLRVLAGWLPAPGVAGLRALAGWFELANIEHRLLPAGADSYGGLFRVGSLGTAASRHDAATVPELHDVLRASPWGDPGSGSEQELQVWLRLKLAQRCASRVPDARPWAVASAVLTVARVRCAAGRPIDGPARTLTKRLLGEGTADAASIDELRGRIATNVRWVLADVTDPQDLWVAEAGWRRRVETDSFRLLEGARIGSAPVTATVGLLAVDAWRVAAALEIAARGGTPMEVFDAVA